jgi:hypothetical protein
MGTKHESAGFLAHTIQPLYRSRSNHETILFTASMSTQIGVFVVPSYNFQVIPIIRFFIMNLFVLARECITAHETPVHELFLHFQIITTSAHNRDIRGDTRNLPKGFYRIPLIQSYGIYLCSFAHIVYIPDILPFYRGDEIRGNEIRGNETRSNKIFTIMYNGGAFETPSYISGRAYLDLHFSLACVKEKGYSLGG